MLFRSLKPRDVKLGGPETVPRVCPSPFSGICMKSWQSLPLWEWHGGGGALSCLVAAIGPTPRYAQTSKRCKNYTLLSYQVRFPLQRAPGRRLGLPRAELARGAVDLIIAARGGMQVLPVLQYILTRAPDSHFSTCCYVF